MIEPSSVLFKASGIYSLVRKCVAAGMPQHVRIACRRVGSSSEEERGNSSKVIANQVPMWTLQWIRPYAGSGSAKEFPSHQGQSCVTASANIDTLRAASTRAIG